MTLWLILLPMITAAMVALSGSDANRRDAIAITGGLLTFFVALQLYCSEGAEPFALFELFPGIVLGFSAEPLGKLFALTAATLWPITTIYARAYLGAYQDKYQTRFHALFCLAIGCAMGIAMADNLITLFLFYEVLTFSTWPLVTHSRNQAALSGGRAYLSILLLTSVVMLLTAIVLVAVFGQSVTFQAGGVLAGLDSNLVMLIVLLFLFGTGKAALMPFHRWLPNAMVAPAPVSALLHAVAVVKAGVFTIVKVMLYIVGTDTLKALPWHDLLPWIPAVTIVLASLIAMRQDDIKARLAYSTISQLSYIVLGVLLAERSGILGSSLHITMHAFGKITLFFCAGAIMVLAKCNKVSQLDGLGKHLPWTFAAFFVATLSIAGLPPAGGVWSKWFLALGVLEADMQALLIVLMLSSLLNLYYLTAIPLRAFFLPRKADEEAAPPVERLDGLVLPLVVTAGLTIMLFFFGDFILHNLEGVL